MTNIADDPSQWDNLPRERNVPERGEQSPQAPQRRLVVSGHSIDDYRLLRHALFKIASESSSARIRAIAGEALDAVPKDGCIV